MVTRQEVLQHNPWPNPDEMLNARALCMCASCASGRIITDYIEPLSGIGRNPLSNRIAFECDRAGVPIEGGQGAVAAAGQIKTRHGLIAENLFDLGYLILANHCDENGEPRTAREPSTASDPQLPARRLFFDAGCARYDDGKIVDVRIADPQTWRGAAVRCAPTCHATSLKPCAIESGAQLGSDAPPLFALLWTG